MSLCSRFLPGKAAREVLALSSELLSSDDATGSQGPLRSANLDGFCPLPLIRVGSRQGPACLRGTLPGWPGHCAWELTSGSIIQEGGSPMVPASG